MELGGAERALLGFLYAIDTKKVDVDLFINHHSGPFMKLIPDNINLLPEIPIYSTIERPIKDIFREGFYKIAFLRICQKIKYKWFKYKNGYKRDATSQQFLYDAVINELPSLHYLGEYNLAISFIDPPHIVQDKVLAKKKIEWIHTDFSSRQRHYDVPMTVARWSANDYIVSISDEVTNAFLLAFPQLESKIIKIENIIPQNLVIAQSLAGHPIEYSSKLNSVLKLCSVGRIASAKNFDNIPKVALILKDKGLDFHWWIVGPGDVASMTKIVDECGVGDYVSFLGSRENPYPYMLGCDIYVQPSRREGKSITVQEAQMLGKPVIITRYPTSGSQIINGEDGIICEMDNQSIADAITSLWEDKDQMVKLGSRAKEMHKGNDSEVEKIYRLLS